MYKALGVALDALHSITSWEGKKKVLTCLLILLGFDPNKPIAHQ
jgi:hypothetical protein